MSFLLIKKGGQRPNKGAVSNRSNGRRNAPLSSAHRHRQGGGQSWRNPSHRNGGGNPSLSSRPSMGPRTASSSSLHSQGSSGSRVSAASGHHQPPRGAVVDGGGGQVQLQRPSVQRKQQNKVVQPQQNQVSQQEMQQGMVSMDEVYADLQILEQQRQESKRKVASIQLAKKQKVEQKHALERRLCELKRQNGGMRVELQRASRQLSLRHRELLEARSRSENSRGTTNRFDAKLKHVVGVARLLGAYQHKIENALIVLNERETRLNFTKGQAASRLQSAALRRDDAKRRHELLIEAANANGTKERSIAEDISKIRADTVSVEQDLLSAQQVENQTRLRVETIEHETSMEQARHADAVADLESKSKGADQSKVETAGGIEEKKAALEAKKAELRAVWEKCSGLRRSEGHPEPDEPAWGKVQPPSLDVARVRARVNDEEVALGAAKTRRVTQRGNCGALDDLVGSKAARAAEKRAKAEVLLGDAARTRQEEASRKEGIARTVDEADVECGEVDKLRDSIAELTREKEKNAAELKLKLDGEEGTVSAMEAEIASAVAELSSVEALATEHKEHVEGEKSQALSAIAEAKRMADMIKSAFERAQNEANEFSASPDEELALQMKQLDEAEQDIIDDASRERGEIIEVEPLLEKAKFDFTSDVSLEEQKEAGLAFVQKHCENFIEATKAERQIRVEHAKEDHLARVREEEEALRLRHEQEEAERLARLKCEEEEAASRKREEEEEERLREEERVAEQRRSEELAAKVAELERKKEEGAAAKRKQEEEHEALMARMREEEEAIRRRMKREEDERFARRRQEEEDAARRRIKLEEEERLARLKLEEEEAAARCKRKEEEEEEERLACRKQEKEDAIHRRLKLEEEERLARLKREEEEFTARRKREEEEEEERRREEERGALAAEKKEAKRRKELMAKESAARKKEEEAATRRKRKEKEEADRARRREERRAKEAESKHKREKEASAKRVDEESKREKRRQERRAKEAEYKRKKEREASAKHGEAERERLNKEKCAAKEEESERKGENDSDAKRSESERKRVQKEKLEAMRASSQEMQERLRAEEESIGEGRHRSREKQRTEEERKRRARRETERKRSSFEAVGGDDSRFNKKAKEDAKKRDGANKRRPSKSCGKEEVLKTKGKSSKSGGTNEKRGKNEKRDEKDRRKRARSSDTVASSKSVSSSKSRRDSKSVTSSKSVISTSKRDTYGHAKSAIRHKDSKRPKTSSSVRFDQSATRQKLDIFSSNAMRKSSKSIKSSSSSSSKPSTQTSGISSSEGGGVARRRKKSSVGGKTKAKVLAMNDFGDDAGFM